MDRAKLYVAISRVTSLRGLFLFGSETIVPPGERNLSLTERQKRIKENAKTRSKRWWGRYALPPQMRL